MITAKKLVKQLILKTCSRDLQQWLRQTHSVYQIMHKRTFREPEMELIKSLVSGGSIAADVGANVGVYTMELSVAVGSQGKVYSFEPVEANFKILSALIRKAALNNVVPFRAAVGSKETDCEVVVPDMSGFTGYYWAHLAEPEERGRGEIVPMVTLDELHSRGTIDCLDFIKCDAEGSELEVIRGSLETIQSQKPGWLIEVSKGTSDDVFSTLRELGYRAFVLDTRLIETEQYRDKEFSNYFFFDPQSKSWPSASLM
jgi:FkbM family methyltransferase